MYLALSVFLREVAIMSKKMKDLIGIICIIAVLIIFVCTPGMALRTSAFMYDAGSAFTLQFEKVTDISKYKTIYRITENVPIERGTEGQLTTWQVFHFGPFHFATYYGEGVY